MADRVLFLSASPGRVIFDMPVSVPRPQEPGDAAVGAFYHRVLALHPELLAGRRDRPPEPG